MKHSIEIAGRRIGRNCPPYVIAELSANHNGNKERALEIVRAAKTAGADAIKLQTYTADTLTINFDGDGFVIPDGLWAGRTLYDLYQEAHMPWDWHEDLFAEAKKLGITVFSSPFDETAADYLEGLGCPAYKIASFELVDSALIEYVAGTGKPLIMSTGMANKKEITDAVNTAKMAGATDIVLLHCISGYPTPVADANLKTIQDMQDAFGLPIGLSDHTIGVNVSIASIAMGACVIEKHFTLDREAGGPDSAFSLEPAELSELVVGCREAFQALGTVSYDRKSSEDGNVVFRRSLYVVEDVEPGEVLSSKNVRSIRPGFGLPPRCLKDVLGRRLINGAKRGTPLDWEMME